MTMPNPYLRSDVSSWRIVDAEPLGTDEKAWLEDHFGNRWLFKPAEIKRNTTRQGQDWAEKIAAEIATLLALPHAHVELVVRDGAEGSVSLRIGSDDLVLREGTLLLIDRHAPGYVPIFELAKGAPRKRRPGHSLENIHAALRHVAAPSGCSLPGDLSAFDIFVGYLILDAWIANRDRHDQNWAVLEPQLGEGPRLLCPTYDHGNSLGYGLSDTDRFERISSSERMAQFAERGTAFRLENAGPGTIPTLVTVAVSALLMASPEGRAHWSEVIQGLPVSPAQDIVRRVPGLSVPARTFAARLLEINAERLSHECNSRL
ncbi:hypothetical protein ACFWH7_18190 [Cellulosimicrobium cellulans]|uniref:hypothetical protein n=1 Tax=Cellulosimicrobium cellulans TaxID=1710 RepID=UPI0036510FFD